METTRTPSNVQGISSGIQWNELIDATVSAETARYVTPLTDRITKRAAEKAAWTRLTTLVQTLNDTSRVIRRAGLGGYTAVVPPSPTTSRTLLSAQTTLSATPGRYRVEVLQLADTAKIGGRSITNISTALGLTGDLTINGTSIAVASTDSLVEVQRKINDANTGVTPTGVTATVIAEGTSGGRLVLTKDSSGAAGVTVTDGTGGIARELGLLDSRTKPISSAVQAAALALGLSNTQPATIRVGTQVISADLAVDSISAIAAKINAAGGSASVESELYGSQTRYRLVTDGNVSAVVGDPNSQALIDALGFAAGGAGLVRQTLATGVYTDSTDAVATSGTLLAGLKLDGVATNLSVGDAINIRGVRGDGTAVTIGLVVGASDTMQTLLTTINDATTGFGAGTRSAAASLGADGAIRLVDSVGGASRLSLSIGITRTDGSAGSLGASTVTNAGRARELQQGRDAVLRVDGNQITRSTNTIADGIPGVNLTLTAAEAGTTIDVAVDRDAQASVDAVTKFKDAFNAIRSFFDEQRVLTAPLYANTALRSVISNFTTALRTTVSTNTSYSSLAVTGLALDRNGALQFDTSVFKTALASKPTEVEALFGFAGVGGAFVAATDEVTRFGIGAISSQTQSIDDSTVRLKRRELEAQKRIELRREQLVARYTAMESALARLQSQGATLSSSVRALQGSGS